MSWVAMAGHCGGWGMNMIEEVWRKGPWTSEEDRLLIEYVRLHGEGRWNSVARLTGLKRNGKSCRLRWVNYLRPDLKRGQITPQEEKLILELHARWGNRWSTIARSLPGRTDNEIKNYWRTHFKNKVKGCSGNTEKVKNARLLRRQQFHQQFQQQQQQQQMQLQPAITCQAEQQLQLNHQFDVKKINSIMAFVNGADNRVVPYGQQVRQEMGTPCDTNTFDGQGLFESSMNNNCYESVHENWNNEDFAWEGLWN